MVLNVDRYYLTVVRVYDPDLKDKVQGLRLVTPVVPHHPSLIRVRDTGATPSPWGPLPFSVFEPLIPLTWFIDYEAGRRRMFPPRFIWALAKATIEGLACLHTCNVTMIGK